LYTKSFNNKKLSNFEVVGDVQTKSWNKI